MSYRILFILIASISFGFTNILISQEKSITNQDISLTSSNEEGWRKFDSLVEINQPNAARGLLNELFARAIEQEYQVDQTKCVLSYPKTLQGLEANEKKQLFVGLDSIVRTLPQPAQTLSSLELASQLLFNKYNWIGYGMGQAPVVLGGDTLNLQDDGDRVRYVISQLNSIESDLNLLKSSTLKPFSEILEIKETSKPYFPTLFDYVTAKIIPFYDNYDVLRYHPLKFSGSPKDSWLLNPDAFTAVDFNENSLHHRILSLYQNWESFHLQDTLLSTIHRDRLKYALDQGEVNERKEKWQRAMNYYGESNQRSKFLLEKAMLIYKEGKNFHFKTNPAPEEQLLMAHKLLKDELKRYPNSDVKAEIQKLIDAIEKIRVQMKIQNLAYPKDEIPLLLEHQNIDEVTVLTYFVPTNELLKTAPRTLIYNKECQLVREQQLKLEMKQDFQLRSSEFLLEGFEIPGNYFIVAVPSKKLLDSAVVSDSTWNALPKSLASFTVSEIMVITEKQKNQLKFIVTNYKTGEPIANARFEIYKNRRNTERKPDETGLSDENGIYLTEAISRQVSYKVSYNCSELQSNEFIYNYESSEPKHKATVLNDRAIYRPGQTVYYKSIIFENGDDLKVASNQRTSIIIRNNVNQVIHEKEYETNEYGSASGSFTLPSGGSLGVFSIEIRMKSTGARVGSTNFRVEEYKRPTFSVEVNEPESEAKLDGNVQLSGIASAFAGYPITKAKVNYKIYRNWRTYRWYYSGSNSGRDLIADSSLQTDGKGGFLIDFLAKSDPNAPENAYYTFEIIADVVDISGETHEARKTISLSKTGLRLVYSGENEITSDVSRKGVFSVLNTADKNQNSYSGRVNVYRVDQEAKFIDRIWADAQYQKFKLDDWEDLFPYSEISVYDSKKVQESLLYTIDFNSGDTLNLNKILEGEQGEFRFKAFVVTEGNDTLRNDQSITFIDLASRNIPDNKILWTYQLQQSAEVGEEVSFQFGSALKDAEVFIQLYSGERLINEEWMNVKRKQSYTYLVKEADRGGLTFAAMLIYNGKKYTEEHVFKVPYSNKKLEIRATSFRDKLLPGQHEEWKFTITGEGSDQIAAEICAGMYDASLDQFISNTWHLWPYTDKRTNRYKGTVISRTTRNGNTSGGWQDQGYLLSGYDQSPLSLSITFNRVVEFYDRAESAQMRTMSANSQLVDYADEEVEYKESDLGNSKIERQLIEDKEEQQSTPQLKVRENFNETAFFYPNLKTNEEGEFVVSFDLPESLTRWKLMMLAHTKEMEIGDLNLEAIAQKPLMVSGNAPRFVRNGDVFTFSSKVINLTEKEQEVEVEIDFFNPLNDEVSQLIGKQPKTKKVTVPKGGSVEVNWQLNIESVDGLIAYKITASNEAFSDGEQKAIPVLSNRQFVTESMPFVLTEKGKTTLSFDPLKENTSSTLKSERYVLEYTSNPTWSAVLALPYLAEYPNECAEQVFSRYYANRLAASVISSKPTIKAMFEEWRNYSPEVFLSELEKNKELKQTLLEETPWILDAQDEEERKRRIAQLFEVNQMMDSQKNALSILSHQQNGDGGFGWFGGNRSNVFITQHIVAGFGHLKRMNIDLPQEATQMVDKAIEFLCAFYSERYQKLLSVDLKPDFMDAQVVHYLYAISYFQPKSSADHKDMIAYYTNQLRENWTRLGLQTQALAGMYFNRIEDEKYANQLLASLRDRAKQKESKGMYFPENNGGYYWNEAKIETHALITEFFEEMKADENEVDQLKLWLLLQKISNAWSSTKATAMATYVLLMSGSDELNNAVYPEIKVGNSQLVFGSSSAKNDKVISVTPGLGYFKSTWVGEEVNKELADIEIIKSTNSPSFGAIYWNYFEDLDKVKQSSNREIQIQRKYRKVIAGQKGDAFVEMDSFSVGDRVSVELKITVQNDLEFVHIKDLRPSSFEPLLSTSQYKWQNGLWYYQSARDASMNYFVDRLPKGSHVLTYDIYVTVSGSFNAGNAVVQCMYAPEYSANSSSEKIDVRQ